MDKTTKMAISGGVGALLGAGLGALLGGGKHRGMGAGLGLLGGALGGAGGAYALAGDDPPPAPGVTVKGPGALPPPPVTSCGPGLVLTPQGTCVPAYTPPPIIGTPPNNYIPLPPIYPALPGTTTGGTTTTNVVDPPWYDPNPMPVGAFPPAGTGMSGSSRRGRRG